MPPVVGVLGKGRDDTMDIRTLLRLQSEEDAFRYCHLCRIYMIGTRVVLNETAHAARGSAMLQRQILTRFESVCTPLNGTVFPTCVYIHIYTALSFAFVC